MLRPETFRRSNPQLRGYQTQAAFEACGRRGYRPVWAQLRRGGVRVSEKVVRRLMREAGPSARRRRRRRWSSYAGEASPAPPDLPPREDGTHDFRARRPNELWVTDITEMAHPSGAKVYLSPVIDCFVMWLYLIGQSDESLRALRGKEAPCGTPSTPGSSPRSSGGR